MNVTFLKKLPQKQLKEPLCGSGRAGGPCRYNKMARSARGVPAVTILSDL